MFGNNGFYGWDSRPFGLRFLIPFAILDLVLKGFALWRAARKGQNWWFIALLLINSLGILPGIYLLTNPEKVESSKTPKKKSR